MKKYCEDCKYLKANSQFLPKTTKEEYLYCSHPKNLGTWRSKDRGKRHPSEINRLCFCSWYEPILSNMTGG